MDKQCYMLISRFYRSEAVQGQQTSDMLRFKET